MIVFPTIASPKTSSFSYMFVEHKNQYKFLLFCAIRLTVLLARKRGYAWEFVSTVISNLDTYSVDQNPNASGVGGLVFLCTSCFIASFHKVVCYCIIQCSIQIDGNGSLKSFQGGICGIFPKYCESEWVKSCTTVVVTSTESNWKDRGELW